MLNHFIEFVVRHEILTLDMTVSCRPLWSEQFALLVIPFYSTDRHYIVFVTVRMSFCPSSISQKQNRALFRKSAGILRAVAVAMLLPCYSTVPLSVPQHYIKVCRAGLLRSAVELTPLAELLALEPSPVCTPDLSTAVVVKHL